MCLNRSSSFGALYPIVLFVLVISCRRKPRKGAPLSRSSIKNPTLQSGLTECQVRLFWSTLNTPERTERNSAAVCQSLCPVMIIADSELLLFSTFSSSLSQEIYIHRGVVVVVCAPSSMQNPPVTTLIEPSLLEGYIFFPLSSTVFQKKKSA